MAINVGDVVRLEIECRSLTPFAGSGDSGTLVDASVTVVVTNPLGEENLAALELHPSVGRYSFTYAPLMPGKHLVDAVATGALVAKDREHFQVYP